jgi:hypothetical protein
LRPIAGNENRNIIANNAVDAEKTPNAEDATIDFLVRFKAADIHHLLIAELFLIDGAERPSRYERDRQMLSRDA